MAGGTARPIPAEPDGEAHALGVAAEVCPPGDAVPAATYSGVRAQSPPGSDARTHCLPGKLLVRTQLRGRLRTKCVHGFLQQWRLFYLSACARCW